MEFFTMGKISDKELLALANEQREKSYCPYSDFAVGAALLCKSGKVYTGSNIENASFTPTVCAERVAFFKAISEGEREFSKIAIVGAKRGKSPDSVTAPCGVCRQVMAEFCKDDFEILLPSGEEIKAVSLGEILPIRFDKTNL